jgi:hypothetical protein
MKKTRMIAFVAACSAALVMFVGGISTRNNREQFFFHLVKNGETVSLICIDCFGSYAPSLRTLVLSDNPTIKNIDLIYPGQKLKLRNPDYTPETVDSVLPLIEKSVSITQGVVTWVEGEAVIMPKTGTAEQKLVSNTIVYPGDVIRTLVHGKVEIIINRETVLRLRERTTLKLNNFRDRTAGGVTRVGCSIGSLWTKMKKLRAKADRFELELPTAIAGVHGTVYETTVSRDTSAEVKVFDGEVAVSGKSGGGRRPPEEGPTEVTGPEEVAGPSEVSMEQWVRIVRDMQCIKIDKKGKPAGVESFQKSPNDSWEQWNEQRDVRISEMFSEKKQ